jgi:hypothetical protein
LDPELDPVPESLVRGADAGIRIRTKMSRIPNTAWNCKDAFISQGVTYIYILDRHKELKGFVQCCGSGGWKKIQIQDLGSGMNTPDLIFDNFVSVFLVFLVKNT